MLIFLPEIFCLYLALVQYSARGVRILSSVVGRCIYSPHCVHLSAGTRVTRLNLSPELPWLIHIL
jgi:hypothetical protein